MVVQACFDKIAKYTYCGRIHQCGFLSDEEAKNVDSELRKRLPKSPRMKAFKERWKIALHFTSEEQLENFNLLNVGFCRKFATPANQCYENNVPKDRKASLSVAWMKVLWDFHNGKATRMILERFLQTVLYIQIYSFSKFLNSIYIFFLKIRTCFRILP